MKRVFAVTVLLTLWCLLVGNSWASRDPDDCGWYDVECVQDQFGVSDYGVWSPLKGAVLYYGDLKKFRIFLFFDQAAINFYQANPWAGLDVDVIFYNTLNATFPRIDFDSVESESGVIALRDTIVEWLRENRATRAITIVNPSQLKVGWNIFSFTLKDGFSGERKITVNPQLVANVSDSSFAKTLRQHNSYGWYFKQYSKWLTVTAGGLLPAYLAINKSGEDVFKYFSIASAMQATENNIFKPETILEISNNTYAKGLCWVNRDPNKPAEVCTWNDLPSTFNQTPTGNSYNQHYDANVQEVSVDDASNQINNGGGVSPIGPGYSTGGNLNPQIQPSSGYGYNNDQGQNEWAGYAHHVGLEYVKVGSKSSDHWYGSRIWPINDIPNHKDFRVKLKRKGDNWPHGGDTCVELWFSHNKYFTDDDLFLGRECKNLGKSKYDDKTKKSFYLEDIQIPQEMEAGKNYYFFTRITYPGGVNPSSRDDSDEYVKVEIADFSSKFILDKISGEIPLTVYFTNKSSVVHGTISSYHWDFGDGYTSSAMNPSHTYTQEGVYDVKLIATASWGEQKVSQSTVIAIGHPPVDGVVDITFGSVDPDNPKEVTEELTEGHCLSGTPSTLLGMGLEGNPWEWTCLGENGGAFETGYAILSEENDDAFRADVNGDGSITSADAMLTSRYAMGLDMSQTDWVDTPTTGDVNCDGSTTSTDANLLLRKSMGMDMSQTDWCVQE